MSPDTRYLIYSKLWRALSRLPLWLHYAVSDTVVYPICYYVLRYRRPLVERQMSEAFPDLSPREHRRLVKRFYHYFADYIVETVKLMTMSPEENRRRVEWVGAREMMETMKETGRHTSLCYLGHLGNWEWLSGAGMAFDDDCLFAQVYHPLRDKVWDALFLYMRQRMGGSCVAMKDTLRHIVTVHREGRREVIGMIADQSPKWEAMHQWCTFLNHETSFFIGTEAIAKRVDGLVYYVDVTRPRRGYYRAEFKPLCTATAGVPDYELTDRYAVLLEESIRRAPHLWLWTHNRWKRTRAEWEARRK